MFSNASFSFPQSLSRQNWRGNDGDIFTNGSGANGMPFDASLTIPATHTVSSTSTSGKTITALTAARIQQRRKSLNDTIASLTPNISASFDVSSHQHPFPSQNLASTSSSTTSINTTASSSFFGNLPQMRMSTSSSSMTVSSLQGDDAASMASSSSTFVSPSREMNHANHAVVSSSITHQTPPKASPSPHSNSSNNKSNRRASVGNQLPSSPSTTTGKAAVNRALFANNNNNSSNKKESLIASAPSKPDVEPAIEYSFDSETAEWTKERVWYRIDPIAHVEGERHRVHRAFSTPPPFSSSPSKQNGNDNKPNNLGDSTEDDDEPTHAAKFLVPHSPFLLPAHRELIAKAAASTSLSTPLSPSHSTISKEEMKLLKALYLQQSLLGIRCANFAFLFNEKSPQPLRFQSVKVVKLIGRSPPVFCFMEPFVHGPITHHTDHLGLPLSESLLPAAFLHFVFQESVGKLLVGRLSACGTAFVAPILHTRRERDDVVENDNVDENGDGDDNNAANNNNDGEGKDAPASKNAKFSKDDDSEQLFFRGLWNQGDGAIHSFVANHECNLACALMHLPRLKKGGEPAEQPWSLADVEDADLDKKWPAQHVTTLRESILRQMRERERKLSSLASSVCSPPSTSSAPPTSASSLGGVAFEFFDDGMEDEIDGADEIDTGVFGSVLSPSNGGVDDGNYPEEKKRPEDDDEDDEEEEEEEEEEDDSVGYHTVVASSNSRVVSESLASSGEKLQLKSDSTSIHKKKANRGGMMMIIGSPRGGGKAVMSPMNADLGGGKLEALEKFIQGNNNSSNTPKNATSSSINNVIVNVNGGGRNNNNELSNNINDSCDSIVVAESNNSEEIITSPEIYKNSSNNNKSRRDDETSSPPTASNRSPSTLRPIEHKLKSRSLLAGAAAVAAAGYELSSPLNRYPSPSGSSASSAPLQSIIPLSHMEFDKLKSEYTRKILDMKLEFSQQLTDAVIQVRRETEKNVRRVLLAQARDKLTRESDEEEEEEPKKQVENENDAEGIEFIAALRQTWENEQRLYIDRVVEDAIRDSERRAADILTHERKEWDNKRQQEIAQLKAEYEEKLQQVNTSWEEKMNTEVENARCEEKKQAAAREESLQKEFQAKEEARRWEIYSEMESEFEGERHAERQKFAKEFEQALFAQREELCAEFEEQKRILLTRAGAEEL